MISSLAKCNYLSEPPRQALGKVSDMTRQEAEFIDRDIRHYTAASKIYLYIFWYRNGAKALGTTFEKYIQSVFPEVSRSAVYTWIRQVEISALVKGVTPEDLIHITGEKPLIPISVTRALSALPSENDIVSLYKEAQFQCSNIPAKMNAYIRNRVQSTQDSNQEPENDALEQTIQNLSEENYADVQRVLDVLQNADSIDAYLENTEEMNASEIVQYLKKVLSWLQGMPIEEDELGIQKTICALQYTARKLEESLYP